MATVQEALDQALRAYRAGALAEAERVCRLVLAADGGNAAAHGLLGAVALQQGRAGDAVTSFTAAARAQPEDAIAHNNLGVARRAAQDLAGAGDSFARALALKPEHAAARANLIDVALRRRRALEPAWRDGLLAPPPKLNRFQIEITTWCNLKCAECSRTVALADGRWANKHMALDDYARIIAHSLPATALVLQGVGEPTLHPQLIEMVGLGARAQKFDAITFNSNALGPGVDYYARAKAAGLTHISVSVDSFDQAIADTCRYGTKVRKLAERVAGLKGLFPDLVVSIVASRLNLDDVPPTIARLAELGVTQIEIQPLINYQAPAAGAADNSLTGADLARLKGLLAICRRDHPAVQIFQAGSLGDAPPSARCSRPFRSPYVTIDGFLTPCCTSFDPAVLGHTSVVAQPMVDAWRRPAVQAWLAAYVATDPAICVGCCFNPASVPVGGRAPAAAPVS